MANPNVPQGVLNRVKASVSWANFPSLNVTAPYLGRQGISLAPDGPATTFLPTMTGAVQSQEVYQKMTLSMHLLRTQNLAQAYKDKMESDSNMESGIVRPDVVAGGISPYQLINCGIENVQPFLFNGTEEGFTVLIGGYYIINSGLFN
jgi:hypothetical protein